MSHTISITALENFLYQRRKYATFVLRIGLGAVFIWSGVSKLIGSSSAIGVCTNKESAISFLETWAWFPFDTALMVAIQSYAELALGILLILGVAVQLVSLLCAALFIFFFFLIDINLIWKNIGLFAASLSLAMAGSDIWLIHNNSFIKNLSKK